MSELTEGKTKSNVKAESTEPKPDIFPPPQQPKEKKKKKIIIPSSVKKDIAWIDCPKCGNQICYNLTHTEISIRCSCQFVFDVKKKNKVEEKEKVEETKSI